MAPKRSVVRRTTRRLVQETVEVSVVEEKDAAARRKVEVQEKTGELPSALLAPAMKGEGEVAAPQPPTPLLPVKEKQPPARGKEEEEKESEEETQRPLESEEPERREEKPQVEEEARGEEERQQGVAANGGLKRERPVGKKEKAAEGKKMEGKEGEGEEKGKKRRRRRRRAGGAAGGAGGGRGYKRYVFRVLKQVHPELRVSSMAMTVLDSLMKDMYERIVDEATRLSKYSGKATLSSREIQGAVRLVLPGELGKHAVAEGTKAVANYMAAVKAGA